MVKIAFVTNYGLDKGGTEKFLQTVAANLPKDKYEVDYYYIDSEPEKVSMIKEKYLLDNGVNLVPYKANKVFSKYGYNHKIGCDFFSKYKGDYNLIVSGSCGLPEDPFTKIKNVPIIQTIHYVSGIDNQYNIARVLHISEFSRDMWLDMGGDPKRVEMISHPIQIPQFNKIDLKKKFEIDDNAVVFGLHQRKDDFIFSNIPLEAYSKIESSNTCFILCGGSDKYREQAKKLRLKKCHFIPATDDNDLIYSFLDSLDVYAHGRFDGELNSTAIAEALYFGLPIITHSSSRFNGHLEIVKKNGYVADTVSDYADAMKKLVDDVSLRKMMSEESKKIFMEKYDIDSQMNNIMRIFDETIENPYIHKKRISTDVFTSIDHSLRSILGKI